MKLMFVVQMILDGGQVTHILHACCSACAVRSTFVVRPVFTFYLIFTCNSSFKQNHLHVLRVRLSRLPATHRVVKTGTVAARFAVLNSYTVQMKGNASVYKHSQLQPKIRLIN